MTSPERLGAALGPVLDAVPGREVGVAVSGGGDSTALLLLMQDWAEGAGRSVAAITIDHGLRAESADEAAAVAALCAARGVPHDIRAWHGWGGAGNLQGEAREARRRLIADWARGRGIAAVALGHTLDDQAETFLLRLARGSGVDGLSGMAATTRALGLVWVRPLLGLRRATLREWLARQGVAWAEDPSNVDLRFGRVRARAALGPLAALGLEAERLAATAARMARARAALEAGTADLAARCLTARAAGDLALDPAPLAAAPEDLRLRLLAGALALVSGEIYRPRLAALESALAAIEAGAVGRGLTLHGCVLRRQGTTVAIRREPVRVAAPVPLVRRIWDGRWELRGEPPPGADGLRIAALGREGLARFPDWRRSGHARETLLTTPALWRGDTPVAAPLLRPEPGLAFRRVSPGAPSWAAALLR